MNKSAKLIICTLFLVSTISTYAQVLNIAGNVRSASLADSLIYYNVTLRSPDSLILDTRFFTTSQFEFIYNVKKESRPTSIEITSMGYKAYITPLPSEVNDTFNVGDILMEYDPYEIGEVVVTGVRKKIIVNNGNLEINPQETHLATTGTLIDMLKLTPGLTVEGDNKVRVLGREGLPLVYINDRKISSETELQSILSENVRNIVIIRNPSAAYDASIKSVVKIYTKRNLQDNFGIKISNKLKINREVSESPSLYLSGRKGILTAQVLYGYDHLRNKNYESTDLQMDNGEYIFRNFSDGTLLTRSNAHNIATDIQLDLSSKSTLNLKYQFNSSRVERTAKDTVYTSDKNYVDRGNILNITTPQRTLHLASLNYNYIIGDNSSFRFVADYASVTSNSLSKIEEVSKVSHTTISTLINNIADYDLYTSALNYTTQFPFEIEFESGFDLSYVDNATNVRISHSKTDELMKTTQNDFSIAPFFSLYKEINKWSFTAGLRYEYAKNKVVQNEESINRDYSNLFPNLNVSVDISDKLSLSTSYSRTISRPSYRLLNPSVIYDNTYSYYKGNPLLNPSYDDVISLDLSYNNIITLSAGYTDKKDAVIETYLQDSKYENKLIMTPINIPRSRNINLFLMYYQDFKKVNIYAGAGVDFPYLEVPTADGERLVNKPSYNISMQVNWKFAKYFSIYSNFSYSSPAESLTVSEFAYNQLDVGVTGSFFNKSLNVNLMVTDILNGSNWNNWDDNYFNVTTRNRGDYDLTGAVLNITYNFNKKGINVKSRTSSRDVINRTK